MAGVPFRRQGFPLALAVCMASIAIGLALVLLSDAALTLALGTVLIAGAWIVPVLYAVRYRSRAQFRKTASGEELRQMQRTIETAVKQVRDQSKTAHNRHGRAIVRLEESMYRLHVTARDEQYPSLEPELDVLFVTSNGAGLGHVSRLLAIAEQLPTGRQYELLTLSAAYRQVVTPGLTVHYFPSSAATGENPVAWNRLFAAHLRDLVVSRRPRVVVFDGTWVYSGLTEVCRAYAIPLVWVQRGLWKPTIDEHSPQRHAVIKVADEVIIPGDFAGEELVDCGPGIEPVRVGPIVRTSRSQMLSRVDSCRSLGLDPRARYVLLNFGGGILQDGVALQETAIRVISEQMPHVQIVQVVSPLAEQPVMDSRVRLVEAYPVTKYARAFDFMIAAAGYNAAQESVSLQIPTVLIPNTKTRTDNQELRARRLAELGLVAAADDVQSFEEAIARLADEAERGKLKQNLASIKEACGAADAANMIEHLLARRDWINRIETLRA